MKRGYIKLHRCIMKSAVWQNEALLQLWIWCLLRACYEEKEAIVGNTFVQLETGQFVFGRKSAAIDLKCPESTVWKRMKALEKAGMLNIKSTNKFSIVTIENWEKYQGEELPEKPKRNKKVTRREQEGDTYKNNKNIYSIIPPTLQMVEEYCLAENLPINPQKFMDYYDSNGWKVGNSKMKNWQATVRNWARREEGNSKPAVQEVKKYTI